MHTYHNYQVGDRVQIVKRSLSSECEPEYHGVVVKTTKTMITVRLADTASEVKFKFSRWVPGMNEYVRHSCTGQEGPYFQYLEAVSLSDDEFPQIRERISKYRQAKKEAREKELEEKRRKEEEAAQKKARKTEEIWQSFGMEMWYARQTVKIPGDVEMIILSREGTPERKDETGSIVACEQPGKVVMFSVTEEIDLFESARAEHPLSVKRLRINRGGIEVRKNSLHTEEEKMIPSFWCGSSYTIDVSDEWMKELIYNEFR